MEPLESTSIHLIQRAVIRLLRMMPAGEVSERDIAEFNDQQLTDMIQVRDFLILHYKASERDDSELWRYCAAMPIPDSLQYKIDHFRSHGMLVSDERELFANPSWIAVYLGQGIMPNRAPALASMRDGVPVAERLAQIGANPARIVVTGDPSQNDLPPGTPSGLNDAVGRVQGIKSVGVVTLTKADIVRHPLVQAIVNAYEQNPES